ncbi:MAG: GerMN domain-containing protein [Thermoclostridium sp.]|nr:GerMN domain-containing protein [Thermoclostridium sp.]
MKKTIIIAVCVILIFTLNGCQRARDKAMKQMEEDELRPVSSIVLSEDDAKRLNEKLPVHLYFSDKDGTKLVGEIRYLSMEDAMQGTDKIASTLVKELVSGPSTSTLKPTVPEGASLRSPVKVEGRTAIVDMTKEFVDNHPGGKEAEEMTIFSIVNTLTELKDVETVKFQVNGKTQKEFKGSFRFDQEFPRNEALIDRKQSFSVMPQEQIQELEQAGADEAAATDGASGQSTDTTEEVSTDENPEDDILE